MTSVTQNWRRGAQSAVGWDRIVKRRTSAIAYNYVAYGSNYRRWYADVDTLRTAIDGAAVLDVPCGGGALFPLLGEAKPVRYVGADVSPVMLARAAQTAAEHPVQNLEMVECDVLEMPFGSEFDICVSYMGLHCMPDPARVVAAMADSLRPGGKLRGSTVVVGAGWWSERAVALWQRRGIFAAVYHPSELRGWLTDAGLTSVVVECSGAIAYFSANKPELNAVD